MKKKIICATAVVLLGIVLLSGNMVSAASRTLALTVSNQKNQTSSEMWCSNQYNIEYYATNGATSYGELTFTVEGTDSNGTYTTIDKTFTLAKDTTVATTGFDGNAAPLSIKVDSRVCLEIKGNYFAYLLNNSNRTIGSAMIYTATDEVAYSSASTMSTASKKTDIEIKNEMDRLKAEFDANMKLWDMQNIMK